jgi:hypothetical protein
MALNNCLKGLTEQNLKNNVQNSNIHRLVIIC